MSTKQKQYEAWTEIYRWGKSQNVKLLEWIHAVHQGAGILYNQDDIPFEVTNWERFTKYDWIPQLGNDEHKYEVIVEFLKLFKYHTVTVFNCLVNNPHQLFTMNFLYKQIYKHPHSDIVISKCSVNFFKINTSLEF